MNPELARRLPKQARLLLGADFNQVFKGSQYQNKQRFFLMLAAPSGAFCARLGVVTPKKYNLRAVDRNQARRLCKACFCEVQGQLPIMDIVILIKSVGAKDIKKLLRPALAEGFRHLVAYAPNA